MGTVRGTSALALVLGIGMAGAAEAQETDAGERQYAQADTLTVTATRTAQDTFDVPNVVTVITDEEIEENLVTDIKDLIRFEPGVSVRSQPTRISAQAGTGRDGNAGFNIRGLEGNRVLIAVDGVRVPDAFDFGGPVVFGRGDYVDLDLLSRVEILRGPASALYGSDGLAGVVSFTTRDPNDFLNEDEAFAARVRASYASADDSWAESLTGAGRLNDAWSALLSYTHRDGHEQENQGARAGQGSLRTEANPQDVTSDAVLGRLVFEPNAAHRFRLTADYAERQVVTDVLTARTATVTDFDAEDESERARISFDHTFTNPGGLIDAASWAAYYQQSDIVEYHFETRTTGNRFRESTFDTEVAGLSGQLESKLATGGVAHHVIFGGDYSLTRQEGVRNGGPNPPPPAEQLPTRPFPNTDFTLTGVFVQDQISLLDGALLVSPALRYDAYELEPEDDALYILPVAGQDDSRVTPRLGVVAWPTAHFGAFFNYAEGFRAPAPTQVNQAFTNAGQFYTTIPNPDLKPETSETFEVGVRLRNIDALGASWRASATAFAGIYEDFIEQMQVSGPPFGAGSPGNLTTFQFVNLGEVVIDGFEARADGAWSNGFGLTAAFSYADGEQIRDGVRSPLESIDPWKIVAGLTYDNPDDVWGGQLIVTHATGKDEDDVAAPATTFRPSSFTILDLTAYWNITDAATVRVGAFNVTDESYWWWSDARNLSATSAVLDAYTQPGRNFSASISYRF